MGELKFKFPVMFRSYVMVFYVSGILLVLSSVFLELKVEFYGVYVFDKIFPTLEYNVNGMYSFGYEDRVWKVRMAYLLQFINGMAFLFFFYCKFNKIYNGFSASMSEYCAILDKDYGGGRILYCVFNIIFYTATCIAFPVYLNMMDFEASISSKFANIGYVRDRSLLMHTSFLFLFFSWLAGAVLLSVYFVENKRIKG